MRRRSIPGAVCVGLMALSAPALTQTRTPLAQPRAIVAPCGAPGQAPCTPLPLPTVLPGPWQRPLRGWEPGMEAFTQGFLAGRKDSAPPAPTATYLITVQSHGGTVLLSTPLTAPEGQADATTQLPAMCPGKGAGVTSYAVSAVSASEGGGHGVSLAVRVATTGCKGPQANVAFKGMLGTTPLQFQVLLPDGQTLDIGVRKSNG